MSGFKKEAFGYIKDMFVQHNMIKRTVLSVLSVLVMGFAISLFRTDFPEHRKTQNQERRKP